MVHVGTGWWSNGELIPDQEACILHPANVTAGLERLLGLLLPQQKQPVHEMAPGEAPSCQRHG